MENSYINLSFLERQIRAAMGTAMIVVPMMINPVTMGLWSIVLLASIPVIASAITGWDPLYALVGKSSYLANEEDIEQRNWAYSNIGIVDRIARFAVGSALIYVLFTMNIMHEELIYTFMAIPLIITAMVAWDPIYALLGINSFGSHTDVEAAEPEATEQMLAKFYKFPQPAENVDYPRAA